MPTSPVPKRISFVVCALLFWGSPVTAQQATVKVSRGPHYVGIPITVSVEVQGFQVEPPPESNHEPLEKGQLVFAGLAAQSSLTFSGPGGTRSRVTQKLQYQFSADEPGRYRLPKFTITQGTKSVESRPFQLHLQAIPISDDLKIHIGLPQKAIYLGQRVPITIEWWYAGRPDRIQRSGFSSGPYDLSRAHVFIRSDLFLKQNIFEFEDEPPAPRDFILPVITHEGRQHLKADALRKTDDGREFVVYTTRRTLIPLVSGEFDLGAASVSVEISRGRRSRSAGELIRNVDLPRTLVVKEPPLAGRPPSWAGGVGQGFSLQVSADRSVVRVDDPITLTLVLQGDGNLEQAGIPSIEAAGLPAESFKVQDGDVAGIFEEETSSKTFEVQVRALSENVREIPPLSYSWFDVEADHYETTASNPIAVSVKHSEKVTSSDVVTARAADGPESPEDGERPQMTAVPGAQRRVTLAGADLAITTDRAVLRRDDRYRLGGWTSLAGLYGVSFAALFLAIVARRRASIDPAELRRRATLQEAERTIQGAGSRPRLEATADIARALRTLANGVDSGADPAVTSFLSECEAVVYAPEGGALTPLDAGFHRRAVDLARSLMERSLR